MRVIGVEPTGATAMQAARAGSVVPLPRVDTIAGTLAPRAVGPHTLAIGAARFVEMVLVSDDEMSAAVQASWGELRVLVEPAAGAAVAALLSGRMKTTLARPALVICGANLDDAEARRGIGAG